MSNCFVNLLSNPTSRNTQMLHAQYINLCLTEGPIRTTMISAWERSDGPTASSSPIVTARFIVTNSLCGVSECDRIVSIFHPMRHVPCPAAQEQRVSASPRPGESTITEFFITWLTVFDRPDSSRDCFDTKGNLPKGIQGHRVAGFLPRFLRRFEPVFDGVFSLFQRTPACLSLRIHGALALPRPSARLRFGRQSRPLRGVFGFLLFPWGQGTVYPPCTESAKAAAATAISSERRILSAILLN